ncbi:MAG: OmpA family protein [Treponema sp.]|jgi:hypothetical protein|nr:OmpA family protein [Treponema sp.]
MSSSKSFTNLKKPVILLPAFLMLFSALHAQTEFPGGNYWAFDTGIGMTDILVKGRSYAFILDPKIWLSPQLMAGGRLGTNYSTDEILTFEGQLYLRWNFMRLGNPENPANIFAQGGVGTFASYRGDAGSPLNNSKKTRGSIMFDAAAGVTIPLGPRWHIEPSVRGGYPHIAGFSLTAGYKFPLKYKQTGRMSADEIIKHIMIAGVDFIMFGPDTGQYNTNIDRDAQGLNELVINNIAGMLKEHPDYRVRIEGHANPVTYASGEPERLLALSRMRADAVARLLKSKEVAEEQMVIAAFGGERIITKDQSIRNRNRRVELIVIQANND